MLIQNWENNHPPHIQVCGLNRKLQLQKLIIRGWHLQKSSLDSMLLMKQASVILAEQESMRKMTVTGTTIKIGRANPALCIKTYKKWLCLLLSKNNKNLASKLRTVVENYNGDYLHQGYPYSVIRRCKLIKFNIIIVDLKLQASMAIMSFLLTLYADITSSSSSAFLAAWRLVRLCLSFLSSSFRGPSVLDGFWVDVGLS